MNWVLLQNSLLVAALSAVISIVLGGWVALCGASCSRRCRNWLLVVAVISFMLPPFWVTSSWIYFLGETGVWRDWFPIRLYSIWGTVWVLCLLNWPITFLLVLARWTRLDQSLLEADLELRGVRLMRWVLLPQALPALAASGLITFVLALNNFAVPAILQTRVFPAELWLNYSTHLDFWAALKLSVPLVLVPVALLILLNRWGVEWPAWGRGIEPRVFRGQMGWAWLAVAIGVTAGLLVLSVGLPLIQILGNAGTWLGIMDAWAASWRAASNSFFLAAGAATILAGASLFLWRWRSVGVAWISFLVPGVFLGISLIYIFNRPGLQFLYQSAGIVWLGLALRYFAVSWHGARRAMRSTDPNLTAIAILDGASCLQKLRHVNWPQIGPSLAAVWYVIYLLCLWDAETVLLIVPPGGETLALRIFNLLHYGYTHQVNALCVMLLGLALVPGAVWSIWSWRGGTARQSGGAGAPLPWVSNLSSDADGRGSARALDLTRRTVLGMACAAAAVILVGCGKMGPNETSIDSQFFSKVQVIGNRGTAPGQFNKPRSLAVDALDNLYVVDMTGRVQKFTSNGVYVLSWQMPQTDKGKPKGMGCDAQGRIIVIEPHYSRVNHYKPDGQLAEQWGEHGTKPGQLTLPRSVAVNSKGEIFVSEYTSVDRVQVFGSANKEFLRGFGRMGSEPAEFNRAEGLGIDAEDRVYVADSCNHRIQVFSAGGQFLRMFGTAGSGIGEFSYPYDVKVDTWGYEFVCEFGNSRVQIFDDRGKSLEILGGAGSVPGKFNNPWGLALDSKGNLYVADALNHRVQKFIRQKS